MVLGLCLAHWWPMPTRPAPQPQAEASSASSAAHPARQEPADCALPPRHHRVNTVFGTDDPSMAPLRYFPPEHLAAVYLPLIVPLIVPMLAGIKKGYTEVHNGQT